MNSVYSISLILLVVCSSGWCSLSVELCKTDANYSMKVCTAIKEFVQERQACNPNEITSLRFQVSSLRGALTALLRERNAVNRCRGTMFHGQCYFLLDHNGFESKVSFDEAKFACKRQKGSLVSIKNKAMYDYLYSYVKENAYDLVNEEGNEALVWTGASYEDGRIVLENNVTCNFSSWSLHHPKNIEGRNRIGFAVSNARESGGMFDAFPSMQLYPLCQKN